MIKIAIVEDEEKEAESLRQLLDRYFAESGGEYACRVFRDGVDFTENYRADYDIVLMDIEMPLMDGMRAAVKLREVDPAVALVFVTNMANYAVKGYEVDAVGFIVKPVSYFALKMNLRKAVRQALDRDAVKLTVVTRQGVSVLPSDEIVYIEVRKHDLVYHTATQAVEAHGSLKDVETRLGAQSFARCSNCYLVNLRFVRSLAGDTVTLSGTELPVSRSKKREFTEKLLNYVGGGASLKMMDMAMDWLGEVDFAVLLEQCLKFYGELVLGFLIFAYPLRKRRCCPLKIAAGTLVGAAVLVPIVFLGYSIWDRYGFENAAVTLLLGFFALFFLLFSFFIVLMTGRIGFAASWWELIFCGICGYSTQHICYRVNLILQYYFFFGTESPWSPVCFCLSIIAVYGLMFLLYGRKLKGRRTIEIENKRLILLYGVVLLAMILCSGLSLTYVGNEAMTGTPMVVVESALTVIICFLAITMLFDGARTKRIQEENRRIALLWKADRKQYEVSRQNVEQLNMKYHDLKYQLRAIKAGGGGVDEIEQSLRIYDALYRTGNETLDVVLTEKSMLAAGRGINIACMADGESLDGMESGYLYSLFGNALDNAIECLEKAGNVENKVIDVAVKRKGDMVSIQFENYAPKPPQMKNGLPVTTKEDAGEHGYGLKSIRNIVEKFGGNLKIDVSDDIFTLDILLPYPLKKS